MEVGKLISISVARAMEEEAADLPLIKCASEDVPTFQKIVPVEEATPLSTIPIPAISLVEVVKFWNEQAVVVEFAIASALDFAYPTATPLNVVVPVTSRSSVNVPEIQFVLLAAFVTPNT